MSILVDKNTTFLVQGITGREAVNLTRECLDYGSKIVGGVTPGRAGRDIYGVPVYDCVRDVVAKHGPVHGSIISVPPGFVRDAAFEAIESGIELIVTETCQSPNDRGYFDLHGIDLAGPLLLCVKAKNHFRAAFGGLCARIIDVDCPGPATADLAGLPFRLLPPGVRPLAA